MKWHYQHQGSAQGPISDEQLADLAARGLIDDQTLVWRSGQADWLPYAQARAQAPAQPLVAQPLVAQPLVAQRPVEPQAGAAGFASLTCSMCGRSVPADEVALFGGQAVCARCKPDYVERLKQGATQPNQFRYGGFWIRFLARIVDGLIMLPLTIGLNFGLPFLVGGQDPESPAFLIATCGGALLGTALAFVYEILMVWKYGATLGKMALRLKVVRPTGEPITVGRSTARVFGYFLSGIILYIGYIIAAFDVEKRSLHDRLCDTRVVYR